MNALIYKISKNCYSSSLKRWIIELGSSSSEWLNCASKAMLQPCALRFVEHDLICDIGSREKLSSADANALTVVTETLTKRTGIDEVARVTSGTTDPFSFSGKARFSLSRANWLKWARNATEKGRESERDLKTEMKTSSERILHRTEANLRFKFNVTAARVALLN